MNPTRLNLTVLRKSSSHPRGTSPREIRYAHDLPSEAEAVSRRQWLRMAGSAAIVASPALKLVSSALLGPVSLNYSKTRVVFSLMGRELWEIDANRFGGSPVLTVEKTSGHLIVVLSGARFPGTPFAADFRCAIEPGILGCQMTYESTLLGFAGKTGFESWLEGSAKLAGPVNVPGIKWPLGKTSWIELKGQADATILPDASLVLEGPEIARLGMGGENLESDAITIRLARAGEKSIIRQASKKRSIIELERGEKDWRLVPQGHPKSGWAFSADRSTFDQIRIEAAVRGNGSSQIALSAESNDDTSRLAVLPGAPLHLPDGRIAGIPICSARYAVAFDRGGDHRALVARFSRDPIWVAIGSAGFMLGDAPAASPFELITEGCRLKRVQCAPAVLHTYVPLAGALVEPTPSREGSRLMFASRGTPQAKQSVTQNAKGVQVVIPSKVEQAFNLSFGNPTVSAIRPDDLLRIDFEFRNLTLQKSGSKMVLTRSKGQQAYIIATFPPQNIAEESFFETAADCTQTQQEKDAGRPPYPPPTPLPAPPVGSRISGPSRLVFSVPSTVTSIDYTLENLLTVCGTYPLSVSAAAAKLTDDQVKVIQWLQSLARKTKTSLQGARGSAQNIRAKIQGVQTGSAADVRKAVQADVNALPSDATLFSALPRAYQPSRAFQKRLTTLQSAVAQTSKSNPTSATQYSNALANFWDTVEQTDYLKSLDLALSGAALSQIFFPSPAEPQDIETALEIPYRLIISPHGYAGWAHSPTPVAKNNRVELWHTRLAVLMGGTVSEGIDALRTIRAIWSPDYQKSAVPGPGHVEGPSSSDPESDANPFRMSLDREDRHELVHLSSNFKISNFTPLPVNVDNLMLTALGAWVNFRGAWDPTAAKLSVENWKHRGTMGRDHYVRVMYAGYLFPFGHRATLVKITERKFQKTPDGETAAYLRQRMFIIVRQPVRTYPAEGQDNSESGTKDARRSPFRSIQITTLLTPNLDSPKHPENPSLRTDIGNRGQGDFWPFVLGQPFEFHMIGEDWDGQETHFAAPVIFVDNTSANDPATLALTEIDYLLIHSDRRKIPVNGQKIAYADSSLPGDTTYETDALLFGVDLNIDDASDLLLKKEAPFYPTVELAQVRIKALEQLVGKAGPRDISYSDTYCNNGFDGSSNKGEVWAQIAGGQEVVVDYSQDTTKSGGLLSPSLSVKGLSRSIGAVGGDLDEMMAGKFNPASFFKEFLSDAKILGSIPLTTILQMIGDFSDQLDRIPKFHNRITADFIDTTYTWNPRLQQSDNSQGDDLAGIFVPNDPDNGMSVTVHIHTPLTGDPPTFELDAVIKNFDLHLIPSLPGGEFLIVHFDSMTLKMRGGQKPDIDVKVAGVDFAGPLSFVNEIKNYIPSNGFSDPPELEVSASGIKAGYSLGIPTIAVGMFSLQNISLSAALGIPFDGNPLSLQFEFCKRQNPFTLTVMIFGGGGFFGVTLNPSGLQILEAALEFGGSLALNLGVASGGVYIMAGIYYKKAGDDATLEGYLRCGGCLEVLGLISVSVEFYMALDYQTNGKVFGQAEVDVKVEVLFFSTTVTLHTERQFAGSAGDPLIKDSFNTVDVWKKYLSAFAS